MYAKKGTFPSGIFLSNAKQKKPFVLLDYEINKASQPLVVHADTSIPFIRKCLLIHIVVLVQAIKALRGSRADTFVVSRVRHDASPSFLFFCFFVCLFVCLFFVDFSSSF